jgi:methyl-accepting chemotaxis protein
MQWSTGIDPLPLRVTMKKLFAPATKLMGTLRMPGKFALVCAVFLVPIIVSTQQAFSVRKALLATTKNEMAGVEYLHHFDALVDATQRHRGRTMQVLGGKDDAKARVAEAAANIEKAVADMDSIDKTLGADLKVTREWAAVKDSWAKVKSSWTAAKPDENFAAHTALIDSMLDLTRRVTENSELVLDPEIDSYYMMDANTRLLMDLSEFVAKSRGKAAYLLAKKEATFRQKADVLVLWGQANDSLAAIRKALATSMANNPSTEASLKPLIADLATVEEYTKALNRDVIEPEALTASSDVVYTAGSKALNAIWALENATSKELTRLLEIRAARLQKEMAISAGVAIACLLVALYLLGGFYISMAGGMKAIRRHLTAVSAGDLSDEVFVKGGDEVAQVLVDVRGMKEQLSYIVTSVRTSSELVGSAAAQIASSNQELSHRTEETGASLESTAQAMEEITATVKHTADSAAEGDQLASQSSQTAGRAGAEVSNVVGTMNAIATSSKKIADIIGVIDGIAFQTNILALNAAVEAARAGEQGRGFAVVAGEVRNLAQRSAGAAKEIKSLIESSVNEVDHGAKLVEQAGTTMRDVVSSVERVTQVISEITTAAREQSAGISQVNDSVLQMQTLAQQNTGMVEESAAAAKALDAEARKLMQAVSVFKLATSRRAAEADEGHAPAIFAAPALAH